MAYTARAAVATATTIDENKLNQILEDATDLRFPSAMLFESRDTLDRLRCRIANVSFVNFILGLTAMIELNQCFIILVVLRRSG